ncbi:MAG: universal stress protein [Candidatus Eremiobacteraeota bacterium]|nr:universal stress protein [Candidatus Eremiobacteraeota bacterium]
MKILVAVNEDDYSKELIKTGATLSSQFRSELYIVYVYEVPLALPLDSDSPEEIEKGDRILDFASGIADEAGISAQTDIIQARTVGAGIVNEARDLGVDLLIIGMKKYPGHGENIISRTVDYVMKKTPCRVMLMRRGESDGE